MHRSWASMWGVLLALLGLTAAGLGVSACVERGEQLSEADRQRLAPFLSREAPSPEHRLDVRFGSQVRLLGYDLSAESANPGDTVTVTWYWKCERDLENGWRLFTHVATGEGENILNQDGVGLVRELYHPERWQAGQYIKDVQEIRIPEDWSSSAAALYVGIWSAPTNRRLPIRHGSNDGDDRARGPRIRIQRAAAAEPAREEPTERPPPALRAARAQGEISTDGQLDEADWGRAGRTARFVNTLNGGRAPFSATARVLYNDTHLFVAFEVEDTFLKNDITDRDGHLWEQDAVEIMVDPGRDGRNYFELQVSPTGAVFDTRYDTRRNPAAPGHVDWNSEMQVGVSTRGTVNDAEADQGYTVEVAIPFSAFHTGTPPADPPAANETWGLNFYVMDAPQAGAQRSAGWSPTMVSDFHMPARFGRVAFIAPRPAQPVQAAEGAPAAAEGAERPIPSNQPPPHTQQIRIQDPARLNQAIRRLRPPVPRGAGQAQPQH